MNFYDMLESVLYGRNSFIGDSVPQEIHNAKREGCDVAMYGTDELGGAWYRYLTEEHKIKIDYLIDAGNSCEKDAIFEGIPTIKFHELSPPPPNMRMPETVDCKKDFLCL
jgi:hypothetical protein